MRILTVLITAFLSCAAAAEDRFYIGGNVGISMIDGTADADPIRSSTPGVIAREISINGLSFDSNETTWSALVGWRATDWLAVEAGFVDLGNTGVDFLVGSLGGDFVFRNSVALNIEEWYVGTKFRLPVSSQFSANWFTGLTRAEFDSQGGLPAFSSFSPFPPSGLERVIRPFASPDDETGLLWGFGFEWQTQDRITLDLGYRKHNTQVIDVDTISLGLLFSL